MLGKLELFHDSKRVPTANRCPLGCRRWVAGPVFTEEAQILRSFVVLRTAAVPLHNPAHPQFVPAMDSSKLPRPSGIPRTSGLPRPSSIPRSSALPLPNAKQSIPKRAPSSEQLPTKPAASSLRPAAIPRAASSLGIPVRPAAKKGDDVFKKPIGRPASRQARSRIQRPAVSAIRTNTEDAEDQLGDLDGFRTSSRLSHRDAHSGEFDFGFDEAQEPQGKRSLPLASWPSLTLLQRRTTRTRKDARLH